MPNSSRPAKPPRPPERADSKPRITDAEVDAIARREGVKSLTTKIPEGMMPRIVPSPGRNKYGAKPKDYDGVRYASISEAKRAETLDGLKRAGAVRWWTGQVPFRLGVAENKYVVDFVVEDEEGVHAEDVKGMETPKFRRDKKLWRRFGPVPLWIIKGGKCVEIIEPEGGR